MLATLCAAVFLHRPSSDGWGPMCPVIDCNGDMAVLALLEGKGQILALEASWTASYRPKSSSDPLTVAIQGSPLIKVPFEEFAQKDLPQGSNGSLGMDALREVTLGVDPQAETVQFRPGGEIGQTVAERYFKTLPAWGGPLKVVRLPLKRGDDGTATVAVQIAGHLTHAILNLSTYDTFFDSTVKRPREVAEVLANDDSSMLANPKIAGLRLPWLSYSPVGQTEWDAKAEGGNGGIALDAFLSRRTIVDLADDAIYVEELSADAQLSIFLTKETQLPFTVSGTTLNLELYPGIAYQPPIHIPRGYQVVSIRGVSAQAWLRDLRDPSAAARLAKRILTLDHPFDMIVRSPRGRRITLRMKRGSGANRQALDASTRAVVRVLSASPSR